MYCWFPVCFDVHSRILFVVSITPGFRVSLTWSALVGLSNDNFVSLLGYFCCLWCCLQCYCGCPWVCGPSIMSRGVFSVL